MQTQLLRQTWCRMALATLVLLLAQSSAENVDLGAVSVVAGSTQSGFRNDAFLFSLFTDPFDCVVLTSNSTSDQMFIADQDTNTIRMLDASTQTVTTIAGSFVDDSFADGTGTAARFNNPSGIDVAPDGSALMVADSGNYRIRRVDVVTYAVTTFAGSGDQGDVDGVGENAQFNSLTGLAYDLSTSDLYVSQLEVDSFRKVASDATTSTLASVAADQHAVAIPSSSSVAYLATSFRIHSILLSTGSSATFAGTNAAGSIDGSRLVASFNRIRGIVIPPSSDFMFVAEWAANRVRRVSLTSDVVDTVIGASGAYESTINAVSYLTTIGGPNGVCSRAAQTLFVVSDHAVWGVDIAPEGATPAPTTATPAPTTPVPTEDQSYVGYGTASLRYRLVGGTTATRGRLEVRRVDADDDDPWTSYCATAMGANTAAAACRALGFGIDGATISANAILAASTTTQPAIDSSSIICTTTAFGLEHCAFSTSTGCPTTSAAILDCPAGNGWAYHLSDAGTLMTRLDTAAANATTFAEVCSLGFEAADAAVACRSLGFSSLHARFAAVPRSTVIPTFVSLLACGGDEHRLDQCFADISTAGHICGQVVSLSCGTATLDYRLEFTNNSHPTTGIVIQRDLSSSGSAPAFFCPSSRLLSSNQADGAAARVAQVACRSVGRPARGASLVTLRGHLMVSYVATVAGAVSWCNGWEGTLAECSVDTESGCDVSRALAVRCPTDSDEFLYRLALGSTPSEGILELRQAGDTFWASLCNQQVNALDAAVICASFGYRGGTAYRIEAAGSRADGRTAVFDNGPECSNTAVTYDDCRRLDSPTCISTADAVYLQCMAPSHRLVDVPQSAVSPTERASRGWSSTSVSGLRVGRVDISPPNATSMYTPVCADDTSMFSADAASAACRALGFNREGLFADFVRVDAAAAGFASGPVNTAVIDPTACDGASPPASSLGHCSPQFENRSCTSVVVLACGTARWQYRLVGGRREDGRDGRVEMRQADGHQWSTMCSRGVSFAETRVVCRSLGLLPGDAQVNYRPAGSADAGDSTQPIAIHRMSCNGDEPTVRGCSLVTDFELGVFTSTRCGHREDLFVECLRGQGVRSDTLNAVESTWQYRIVGESERSGRLETRPNATAEWGTVCNDGFEAATDGSVACRSLGYDPAGAIVNVGVASGIPNQPIYLDDLRCVGDETSIDRCPRAATVGRACTHDGGDVGLTCRSRTPEWQYRLAGFAANSTYGRLELRHTQLEEYSQWGTVCIDQLLTDDVAGIACRSLGMRTAGAQIEPAPFAQRGLLTQPVYLTAVRCLGFESDLGSCQHVPGRAGCSHARDTVISCRADTSVPTTPAQAVPPGGWEFRLVDADGFSTNTVGRLEARRRVLLEARGPGGGNAFGAWGTVCLSGFTRAQAHVACRGFGHATTADEDGVIDPTFSVLQRRFRGDRIPDVALSHVVCSGHESSLTDCEAAVTGEPQECTPFDVVQLACLPRNDTLPATAPWEYALVGNTSTSGRLEARQGVTDPWATVCRLPQAAGDVACRSLGFRKNRATVTIGGPLATPIETQPFELPDVQCRGPEQRLDQCAIASSGITDANTCTHERDTILTCQPSTVEYRLRAGESTSSGRLEMRRDPTSAWTTVCATGFDRNAAVVACKSLELAADSVSFRRVTASETTVAEFFHQRAVFCQGTESTLDFCEYPDAGDVCFANDAIYLACGAPTVRWQVRLADGSSVTGRLEVRPNATVPWGTYCASTFTAADARVACRALGFDLVTTAATMEHARDTAYGAGTSSVPVWFTGGECFGTEASPELCRPGSTCGHDLDVAVSCFPVQTSGWTYRKVPSSGPTGELQARASEDAAWGSVCASGFTVEDGTVACRVLGFRSSATVATWREISVSRSPALDELGCTGVEASLDVCPAAVQQLDNRGNATVTCGTSSSTIEITCRVPSILPNPEEYSFRLDVVGNRPGRGLLRARPNDTAPWGTVCNLGFADVDASAACRSLGYSGRFARIIPTPPATASQLTAEDAPIYLQHANCISTSPSLEYCPVLNATDCTHSQDVSLDCSTGDFDYRLVDATGASSDVASFVFEGRLEARQNSTDAWGTVCYESFTQVNADAACRTMFGLPRGTGAFGIATHQGLSVNVSSTDVTLSRVVCSASPFASLHNGECDFELTASATCLTHTVDVFLRCFPTISRALITSSTLEFRLTDLTQAGRGRLQARPSVYRPGQAPPWGEVCNGGFSTKVAGLICQELGFRNAIEGRFFVYGAGRSTVGLGPIYMDTTTCRPTASDFTECDTGFGSGQCVPSRSIGIDCRGGLFQYRLVGTTSQNTGRVEVRPNSTSPWGTVCTRGMTAAVAGAACRSIGFRSDSVASLLPSTAVPGASAGTPILYSDVRCTGSELSLALCDFDTVPDPRCTHADDLRVTCGAAAGEAGCAGPEECGDWIVAALNARPDCAVTRFVNRDAIAGTVSDVDCRVAARAAADAAGTGVQPSYVLWPDRTRCEIYVCEIAATGAAVINMSDTSLADVQRVAAAGGTPYRWYAPIRTSASAAGFCSRAVSCGNRGSASVRTTTRVEACIVGTSGCLEGSVAIPTDRLVEWGVRLTRDSTMNVTTPSTQGWLEVQRPGSAWEAVCGDQFDTVEARIACTALGYPASNSVAFVASSAFAVGRAVNDTGAPRTGVALSGLACTGIESRLERCPFVELTSEQVAQRCPADGAGDVYLVCDAGADTPVVKVTTVAPVAPDVTSNVTTNATLVTTPVTTAPLAGDGLSTTVGSRVVLDSACRCSCDDGFFGETCTARAAMTTVVPEVYVVYRGVTTALSFAERVVIAELATAEIGIPGVRVSFDDDSIQGELFVARFAFVSDTRDATSESSAALALLQRSVARTIRDALVSSRANLEVVDIALASYVLRDTIRASFSASLTGDITVPSVLEATGQNATNATGDSLKRVTAFRIDLRGASTVGSSASGSLNLNGQTFACTPSVSLSNDPCQTVTSCTFRVPATQESTVPTIRFDGVVDTCTSDDVGTRRQGGSTASITAEFTVQSRVQTSYLTPGEPFERTVSSNTAYALFITWTVSLFLMLIAVPIVVCLNFTNQTRNRRVICVLSLPVFGMIIFFIVFSIRGILSSQTFEPAGYAFVDEYRSEMCDASNTSFVPHRISRIVADETCHKLSSYGTSEQTYWARVNCAPTGSYNPNNIEVSFGLSEAECENAPVTTVTENSCLEEQRFMAAKPERSLEYAKVLCTSVEDGNARVRFIEGQLDSVDNPNVADSPTEPPVSARTFQEPGIWHFFVGNWRSFASQFVFRLVDTVSSVTLAAFSEQDVTAGRVGLPLDTVAFQSAPPKLLERTTTVATDTTGMATLAPLFNGFGSAIQAAPASFGSGALRMQGIKDTMYDLGTLDGDRGFTITFWVRATLATRGFVFLATDAWLTNDGTTPIASRLQLTIENADRAFFDSTWSAYSAIYLDGAARTIHLLYRNPSDVDNGARDELVWDDRVVGGIFDDTWHFIGLGLTKDRDQAFVQIFVDGVTSYTENRFKNCLSARDSFPRVRDLPSTVPVIDSLTERVEQRGVAYVGHLNAGVYAFEVHNRLLEHQIVVSLGAEPMAIQAAVWTAESRMSGYTLLTIAGLSFILMIAQVVNVQLRLKHMREEGETVKEPLTLSSPEPRADQPYAKLRFNMLMNKQAIEGKDGTVTAAMKKKGAAAQAGKHGATGGSTAAGSSTSSAGTSLFVVLPIAMTVFQNMTLYFQGWTWPFEFQITFEWVYFPFSLDFFVLPNLPIYATYIVQFVIALIAMGIVLYLSRNDKVTFEEQVIGPIQRSLSGLWNTKDAAVKPRVDASGNVSVLQYTLHETEGSGSTDVFGLPSRGALQNAVAYAIKGQQTSTEPVEGEVIVILLRKQRGWFEKKPKIPQYLGSMLDFGYTLTQVLEQSGFVKIHESGLLNHYRTLPKQKPLHLAAIDDSHAFRRDKALMLKTIREVATHYTLAVDLFDICDEVLERLKQRARATCRDKVQAWLAGSSVTDYDPNRQSQVEDARVQKAFEYILKHSGDTYEINRQLLEGEESAPTVLTFTQDYGQYDDACHQVIQEMRWRKAIDKRDSTHLDRRSFLRAASDAGIKRLAHYSQYLDAVSNHGCWDGAFWDAHRAKVVEDRFDLDSHVLHQVLKQMPPERRCTCIALLGIIRGTLFTDKQTHTTSFIGDSTYSAFDKEMALYISIEFADTAYDRLVEAIRARYRQIEESLEFAAQSMALAGFVRLSAEEDNHDVLFYPAETIEEGEEDRKRTIVRRKEDEKPKRIEPFDALTHCPYHSQRLFPAVKAHEEARAFDPAVYKCSHENNIVYKAMCIEQEEQEASSADPTKKADDATEVEGGKPESPRPDGDGGKPSDVAEDPKDGAGKADENDGKGGGFDEGSSPKTDPKSGSSPVSSPKGKSGLAASSSEQKRQQRKRKEATTFCYYQSFYVCRVASCNFSICGKCMDLSLKDKGLAHAERLMYRFDKEGFATFIGLAVIFIAQVMYQPAMRSAVTTVFCHASLSCQFPTCYDKVEIEFLSMAIVSTFMILFIGIGFVWFLWNNLKNRKTDLLVTEYLSGYLQYPGGMCGHDPQPFRDFKNPAWYHAFTIRCIEFPGYNPYETLLKRDTSMFKGLYEQYQFRWMLFHPTTFVFKIASVMVVLFAGEPNSLRIIIFAAIIEVTQLVVFLVASPFTNSWLNTLAKAGGVHQAAQLGLMCLFRADVYEDPNNRSVAWAMVAVAIVYLVLVLVVIIVVVIVPIYTAYAVNKEEEEKMKKEAVDKEKEKQRALDDDASLSLSQVGQSLSMSVKEPKDYGARLRLLLGPSFFDIESASKSEGFAKITDRSVDVARPPPVTSVGQSSGQPTESVIPEYVPDTNARPPRSDGLPMYDVESV